MTAATGQDPGRILVLINGASGAGKTTAAAWLQERLTDAIWIHPDGRWPTPSMTSGQILLEVLNALATIDGPWMALADCQIRGSEARDLLAGRTDLQIVNVVLTCEPVERARRLRHRDAHTHDLRTIEVWSEVLRRDAVRLGDPVVDTTAIGTAACGQQILAFLERQARLTPGLDYSMRTQT